MKSDHTYYLLFRLLYLQTALEVIEVKTLRWRAFFNSYSVSWGKHT